MSRPLNFRARAALGVDDGPRQPDPISRYQKAFTALPGSTPVLLHELPRNGCHWPIGDQPTLFCGLHTETGRYCPEHERMSGERVPAIHNHKGLLK